MMASLKSLQADPVIDRRNRTIAHLERRRTAADRKETAAERNGQPRANDS